MADHEFELSFRTATAEDSIFIAQLLRRFYNEAGKAYGISYDHASCIHTVLDVIVRGICLVGSASCAGALIMPFPFNFSARIAQVIFWKFEKNRELAIFDQLFDACKKSGATHISATALPPRQTGKRFYQCRGMHLAEFEYIGSIAELPLQNAKAGVKERQ